MNVVIDTNIVFSTLHASNERRERLLWSGVHHYSSCPLLWLEIERYNDTLRQLTRRTLDDFETVQTPLQQTVVLNLS
jgi:hypothetical protein